MIEFDWLSSPSIQRADDSLNSRNFSELAHFDMFYLNLDERGRS